MKDLNNIKIKEGDVCRTHDRFGGVWIAPIHKEKVKWCSGEKEELVFDSNYKTVLHDYWVHELEIIGNEKVDNSLVEINCSPWIYKLGRLIWEIQKI